MEKMDADNIASILAFFNLLTADIGLEDCHSIAEVRNLMPIIASYIESGVLSFVNKPQFGFREAAELLCNTEAPFCTQLNGDLAKQGNELETAKICLVLIYALYVKHKENFSAHLNKLNKLHHLRIAEMISLLDDRQNWAYASLAHILQRKETKESVQQRNNLQIFSTPVEGSPKSLSEEDATKYKIKSAELETRLKQVETQNTSLNEQLSIVQNEYSDLEHRFESMKSVQLRKQETIDDLQSQLKETVDESEMMRYENSQLQRELKNSNERLSKVTEKLNQELKGKEGELNMLYRRLDDYVKQLAAKESVENRAKFLEQQMSNQQGIQRELREELEKALNRANIAEAELNSLKKQTKNGGNIPANDKENSRNSTMSTVTEGAISLHDELNQTMYLSANSNSDFNGLDVSLSTAYSTVTEDELAQMRTRMEMLELEKKRLVKTIEENAAEMEGIRSVESQSVLDKAIEIERLKQESESAREEVHKLRQKGAIAEEKLKTAEDENNKLTVRLKKLQDSLEKAASVIEEYSNASETNCSAAELLQVRHELERAQTENQRLLAKMDQFRHEATQEQRLITANWYSAHMRLFKSAHGLENRSCTPSQRQCTSSAAQSQHQPSPSSGDSTKAKKSFFKRQMETSTAFSFRLGVFAALLLLLWYVEYVDFSFKMD